MEIPYRKLHESATVPTRATEGSAGYDLYACESGTIEAGKHKLIATGIAVGIPDGFEGQVRSRSGLAAKNGVFVLNSPGTIDSDYRGEVKVNLYNTGNQDFIIRSGDRIAQLVVARHEKCVFNLTDELDETKRGAGGFGSTGS